MKWRRGSLPLHGNPLASLISLRSLPALPWQYQGDTLPAQLRFAKCSAKDMKQKHFWIQKSDLIRMLRKLGWAGQSFVNSA